MRQVFIALVFVCAPFAAIADALCEELWLVRNEVFDRAGYCFGSPLGQAVFDNSDCETSSPMLGARDEQLVAMAREVEGENACAVDTNRTALSLPFVAERRALRDLAVPTGFESGCIGWRGAPAPIFSGRDFGSAQTGTILPGMDLLFGHMTEGDWEFVDLGNGQLGWMDGRLFNAENCTGLAG